MQLIKARRKLPEGAEVEVYIVQMIYSQKNGFRVLHCDPDGNMQESPAESIRLVLGKMNIMPVTFPIKDKRRH